MTELANLAMEKRGYVVLAHREEGPLPTPIPGDIIRRPVPGLSGTAGYVSGPFRVLSETDLADSQEQNRQLGIPVREPGWGTWHWFRVVAE
jgi:hypothetical protein